MRELDLFPEVLWVLGLIMAITWSSAWFAPTGTERSALVAGFFAGGIAAIALLFLFAGAEKTNRGEAE